MKKYSWGVIVLFFVVFFPVGIWMLVKKMDTEKENFNKNGKNLRTLGWILLVLGSVYSLTLLTSQTARTTDSIPPLIFIIGLFGGGGVLCLINGKKYINLSLKYSRYNAIINCGGDTSIDNIASAYPTSYENAKNDLQNMINDGYLEGAYIDENLKMIMMPRSNVTVPYEPAETVPQAKPASEAKVITCPNCGARNTITGAVCICEYCGSPLQMDEK